MNFVEAVREVLNGRDVIRENKTKINKVYPVVSLYVKDRESNWGNVTIAWEAEGLMYSYNHHFYDLELEDYLANDYVVMSKK